MKYSVIPADAAEISLDPAVPPAERPAALQSLLDNLHRFQVGTLTVELEFPPSAPTLQAALTAVLLRRRAEL